MPMTGPETKTEVVVGKAPTRKVVEDIKGEKANMKIRPLQESRADWVAEYRFRGLFIVHHRGDGRGETLRERKFSAQPPEGGGMEGIY